MHPPYLLIVPDALSEYGCVAGHALIGAAGLAAVIPANLSNTSCRFWGTLAAWLRSVPSGMIKSFKDISGCSGNFRSSFRPSNASDKIDAHYMQTPHNTFSGCIYSWAPCHTFSRLIVKFQYVRIKPYECIASPIVEAKTPILLILAR